MFAFGFENNCGEFVFIEKEKIDVAVGRLLKIFAELVEAGCGDLYGVFKGNVCGACIAVEKTPTSFFEELVYLYPGFRLFHSNYCTLWGREAKKKKWTRLRTRLRRGGGGVGPVGSVAGTATAKRRVYKGRRGIVRLKRASRGTG